MTRFALAALVLASLAGCASPGADLVAGKSTAAEVQATMGRPTERITLPDGRTALYYSRLPYGRVVYVVTLGPDGVVQSVEQRLTRENIAKIVSGVSNRKDVHALFGPPGAVGQLNRQKREWWEYRFFDYYQRRVLWVQFSDDGIVREVLDMIDPEDERLRDGLGSDGRN